MYFWPCGLLFLSTLSLRRATDWPPVREIIQWISIHALLAESDLELFLIYQDNMNFYPRSPCGERLKNALSNVINRCISIHALLAESDPRTGLTCGGGEIFLSTLSLRRATLFALLCNLLHNDFYPRSPCGERPNVLEVLFYVSHISIHALLAESDKCFGGAFLCIAYFYPRSPCGERRSPKGSVHDFKLISIHALLAESDYNTTINTHCQHKFLSTLSLRRATFILPFDYIIRPYFYPRSPCGERHTNDFNFLIFSIDFYPRSPCGERPAPEGAAVGY